MKFIVQTCVLSSRWKLLWTSMPCLKFSTDHFRDLHKFDKFVTHVLCHRNHQVDVSSVKLQFHGALNQVFVEKIANYVFVHNVKELTVVVSMLKVHDTTYPPPCLFKSRSLKHFKLSCKNHTQQLCDTTKTALDFPALTTLNLSGIKLCGDVFSKCVNLEKLTLNHFRVKGLEGVFDIITPRLSTLMLINGYVKVMNVIAPQLEKLIIMNCSINYLNAPPQVSCLYYTSWLGDYDVLQFSNDRFHSLNYVFLSLFNQNNAYKEEDARKVIKMLQKLGSARYLMLNAETVEGISSFPDLLSQHPSPFTNLIKLNIMGQSSMRKDDTNKVKMSTEATHFFLGNSPNARVI